MRTKIVSKMALYVLSIALCFSAMAANTGDVQITCRPGIRIYLDGKFKGITKADEDGLYLEGLKAGTYKLRAEKSDFMPQTFSLQIKAGETIEVKIGELVPDVKIKQEGKSDEGKIKAQVGNVIITSVPLRCKISFVGKDINKTKDKVTIEGVPVGTYPIVFKRGSETLRAELDIESGVTLAVKGHFRQGKVLIDTSKSPFQADKIGKDGVPMMLIPAGEFQMGSNDYNNEKPVHPVYVDAFYMDKYEVTNEQYKKFIDANLQWSKSRIERKYHDGDYLKYWDGNNYSDREADYPVGWVSWYAANAYAEWAGKRLPTEAEYEKAARGGLKKKKFPWGDRISSDDTNYPVHIDSRHIKSDIPSQSDISRWETKFPVGSFDANGYGLYDMAGNIWEWCADWYDKEYYSRSPRRNPTGPSSGKSRVLRGGKLPFGVGNPLRCADRESFKPTNTSPHIGFRCCASLSD